jgi:hypothetical protein
MIGMRCSSGGHGNLQSPGRPSRASLQGRIHGVPAGTLQVPVAAAVRSR